ncbi:Soluble lytic murein transglycosylase precursor [Cognatishimia activa]|uniref:Soluble lytic murein transglycosylase n=1 Tax=Cognatishimia activa TaxID=1715691 RepID=A0A0P1ISD6_9RHOB|nr:Soluble lytic murein transglycosylase precursor [Cognatishimia activa]CUK26410.1 Soluble lytic murein transglycosylase precursor [Cognatishimia activa]
MQIRQLAGILGLLIAFPFATHAETAAKKPPPFPDFQAKRLKPPSKDETKRIKVQVEERANPAVPPAPGVTQPLIPPADTLNTATPAQSLYEWFWASIDASPETPNPGRLADAVEAVITPDGKQSLPPPRLQSMQDIATAYGRDILLATIGTEVSPAIALAVIYTESAGNPAAVSKAGALGLMQLMPVTVERFEVADATLPSDNIKGGVAFLDVLLKRYNGDPILALAAYNAGEGAVRDHGGVPPFPETKNYVPRVMSAYSVARGLCTTQPLLPSDPCIFAPIAN